MIGAISISIPARRGARQISIRRDSIGGKIAGIRMTTKSKRATASSRVKIIAIYIAATLGAAISATRIGARALNEKT